MTANSISVAPGTTGTEAPPAEDKSTAAAPGEQKQEQQQQQQQEQPQRPDWIPEKFWKGSVDASGPELAKAYSELEKKLGSGTQQQEQQQQEQPPANADDARKELEKRGLDFDKFAKKFAEKGGLEDADYKELEDGGVPRSFVDAFIAGQKAIADNTVKALYDAAGGQDQYGKMIEWASQNWSDAEIAAFNKTVEANDANALGLAIRGLRAQFEAANGSDAQRKLGGGIPAGGTGDVYRSLQEMKTDMAKPEYKSDPAFRARVQEKLARSNI